MNSPWHQPEELQPATLKGATAEGQTAPVPLARPLQCVHFLAQNRSELGGVIQVTHDICTALVDRGHHVTMLTCDATDVPSAWLDPSTSAPQVVSVPASRWSRRRIGRDGVAAAQAALEGADVIHLHTPWSAGNLQLAAWARERNIPFVVTTHGMLDDWSMSQKPLKKQAYLRLFAKSLLKSADVVHFTAEEERRQALRRVPAAANNSRVVPCLIDLTQYEVLPGPDLARSRHPLSDDTPNVLFLSRLHHKKGLEVLIDSAHRLHRNGRKFRLLIAGPGDEQYIAGLKRRVQEHDLSHEIRFLGMVQGPEKLSLYQAADLFVLPTYQENFGLVLVEAMACGTPVLTTQGTGIWREVERGGGMIVEPTLDTFSEALDQLLGNPEETRARGGRGRPFVREWLDRANIVSQYEQLYSAAIENRQAMNEGPPATSTET